MKLTAQLKKSQQGFTLIELIVVIGILAILLSITLIAVNPARLFGNANNTKRRSDVTQILNAIGQHQAQNKGQRHTSLPINTAATELSEANFVGLCDALVPEYIPALPTNPSLATTDVLEADCATYANTDYFIAVDAGGRVTVSANPTDNSEVIEVSR